MKIILISIGTRGDMEPFLAIGELLQRNGHQVICAFPEQFRTLAEASGLEFYSLGTGFIAMLESEAGVAALGGSGSGLTKFMAYVKLALKQTAVNKELVAAQTRLIDTEKPDRIVYNGKAICPVIWEMSNPGKTILVSPVPYMHYVRDHTHVAFNSNFGPLLNKLTHSLARFGMVTTVKLTLKWIGNTEEITRKQIRRTLLSNRAIYTISPSLVPRPNYWPDNLMVLGYHQRKLSTNWQPDDGLAKFLKRHQNILFITFGSMTNAEPETKTAILLDVLERNGIPAIINIATGGLVKPDDFDSDLIHFTDQVPYDWIFPKVHCVIHHGGSGTTHLALKYGCASMIIPHIIDQFVWDKIISELGSGPRGVKINKFTRKNIEPKIKQLVNTESYRERAMQIANQMHDENFNEELYNTIINRNIING